MRERHGFPHPPDDPYHLYRFSASAPLSIPSLRCLSTTSFLEYDLLHKRIVYVKYIMSIRFDNEKTNLFITFKSGETRSIPIVTRQLYDSLCHFEDAWDSRDSSN